MKVKLLVSVLRSFVHLDASSNDQLAASIDQLGKAWASAMNWSVKDLISRAMRHTSLPDAKETSVAQFRDALLRLQTVIKDVAKKDINTDIAELISALEPYEKADLAAFVHACQLALDQLTSPPSNSELVEQYAARLRSAHKVSDEFVPVYEELQRDKRIKQSDLARIASLVAYETPVNTPKREALRRIWLVHESYATAAAKSKLSKGRSAA